MQRLIANFLAILMLFQWVPLSPRAQLLGGDQPYCPNPYADQLLTQTEAEIIRLMDAARELSERILRQPQPTDYLTSLGARIDESCKGDELEIEEALLQSQEHLQACYRVFGFHELPKAIELFTQITVRCNSSLMSAGVAMRAYPEKILPNGTLLSAGAMPELPYLVETNPLKAFNGNGDKVRSSFAHEVLHFVTGRRNWHNDAKSHSDELLTDRVHFLQKACFLSTLEPGVPPNRLEALCQKALTDSDPIDAESEKKRIGPAILTRDYTSAEARRVCGKLRKLWKSQVNLAVGFNEVRYPATRLLKGLRTQSNIRRGWKEDYFSRVSEKAALPPSGRLLLALNNLYGNYFAPQSLTLLTQTSSLSGNELCSTIPKNSAPKNTDRAPQEDFNRTLCLKELETLKQKANSLIPLINNFTKDEKKLLDSYLRRPNPPLSP